MVKLSHEFYDSDPLPRTNWRPATATTNSGTKKKKKRGFYHSTGQTASTTEEKEYRNKEHGSNIPILKSNHTIYVSYTYATYTLSLLIIALCLFILLQQPFPWVHTFPPLFLLFQSLFHSLHVLAHVFDLLVIERFCIVYGTWLCWTGWLLSKLLFTEKLFYDNYTTHICIITLFWILILERRNAWGIIAWETVSQFTTSTTTTDNDSDSDSSSNFSFQLFIFRIWCLLSTGSFWGLVYISLAKWDGYQFNYLLQWHHIMKLLLISSVGGLIMIVFWSFWTFQFKGIIWQQEARKGIVVWYNEEGIAYAAEVK